MNPQIRKRLLRTALLSLAALTVGGLIAFAQIAAGKKPDTNKPEVMKIAGADIGGPFNLTGADGKTVTEKNFEGQFKLIYFGFTYCPAICPTELQKITKVVKRMESEKPDLAARLQPLFITIDPERDTPPVVGEYVKLFHPRLIGLSGSPEQIEAVKKSYRIFAAKVQQDGMNEYTMDHSSFIYLMDPKNQLAGIYRTEDGPELIFDDVRKQMVAIDTP
jgi:protein SCO1/2